MEDRSHEDVPMGGGLAALSLAVQLRRRDPGSGVPVAERALHRTPVAGQAERALGRAEAPRDATPPR